MADPVWTEEEAVNALCDALAEKARQQQQAEVKPQYAIFLGNSLYPMNNSVFSAPGHARNSLYHELGNMMWFALRGANGRPLEDYYRFQRWLEARGANNKKKLVDAVIARGVLSIKEVVSVHGQRQHNGAVTAGLG